MNNALKKPATIEAAKEIVSEYFRISYTLHDGESFVFYFYDETQEERDKLSEVISLLEGIGWDLSQGSCYYRDIAETNDTYQECICFPKQSFSEKHTYSDL